MSLTLALSELKHLYENEICIVRELEATIKNEPPYFQLEEENSAHREVLHTEGFLTL